MNIDPALDALELKGVIPDAAQRRSGIGFRRGHHPAPAGIHHHGTSKHAEAPGARFGILGGYGFPPARE